MKPLYIFDIDGTLADLTHRVGEATVSKGFGTFFELCDRDIPIVPVIRTLNSLLLAGCEVWAFSGRSDVVRDKTVDWLVAHTNLVREDLETQLVMRRAGDTRPDDIVKQEFLDCMLLCDRERLVAVFDDRQRVVEMWRKNGIVCFQVAPGNF